MDSTALPEFKLERYFAEHEFTVQYLASCSDPESFKMVDILALSDDECHSLWNNLSLGYTESKGHPLVRKEVATMYPGLSQEDILQVVPQEGIYIAMRVLASICQSETSSTEKPHVVATFPAYQSLHENLRYFGCDVTLWHAECRSDGWHFDLDVFKSLLQEKTKIVVVNFPHNPTGYLPPDEDWHQLVDICKERDIYLFSDEMYRLTNNDGSEPHPSACILYEKAITLSGLSKTFGLPGLRMGWLCTQNKTLMQAFCSFKDYITICSPAPAEILAIIALRNRQVLLTKVMSIIDRNLQLLDAFFKEFPHLFDWYKPRACTTGFVRLKGWTLTLGVGGAQGFCDVLREEAQVLLVPASLFDFPDVYVRLGFGRKNLSEIIPVLRAFLVKHEPGVEES